jgi:hypothetical protein
MKCLSERNLNRNTYIFHEYQQNTSLQLKKEKDLSSKNNKS